MDEHRKLRVFLCHASQDKPVVRELYQQLLVEGWIDPWLDEEKLLPGQDWDLEIERAVESADTVIVCLSSNSVTKEGYVQREMRFVLDIALEKPDGVMFIIPLRLEECQPPRRLRSWQYVDYFPTASKDKAFDRILGSLASRAAGIGISQKNLATEDTSILHSSSRKNTGSIRQNKIRKPSKDEDPHSQTGSETKSGLFPNMIRAKLLIYILLLCAIGLSMLLLLNSSLLNLTDKNIPPEVHASPSSELLRPATFTPSVVASPTFLATQPSQTYKLLYQDWRDGDIYTYDFDQRASERFLDLNLQEAMDYRILSLALSPDLTRIAFTRDDDIYIVNTNGENLVRLTNHPANDISPVWSPDGTQIIFASNRNDLNTYESYSINSDGANLEGPSVSLERTHETLFLNTGSVVSAEDPPQLVLGERAYCEVSGNGIYSIRVVDVDGSVISTFDTEVKACLGLALSLDGKKIALVSPLGERQSFYGSAYYEGFYVHIFNRQTFEKTSVIEISDLGSYESFNDISWLPSNDEFIVSSDRFFNSKMYTENYLRVFNTSGISKWVFNHSEAYHDDNDSGYEPLEFSLSPDGKSIIISSINLDAVYAFYQDGYEILKIVDRDHSMLLKWLLVN